VNTPLVIDLFPLQVRVRRRPRMSFLRCVALRSRKNYTRQIGPHTCMYRPYIQLAQHVYVRTSLTDLQVVLRCRANSEKRAESLSSRGSGTFRSPLLFPGLRWFAYRVRRGAGAKLMYVTTGVAFRHQGSGIQFICFVLIQRFKTFSSDRSALNSCTYVIAHEIITNNESNYAQRFVNSENISVLNVSCPLDI